MSCLLTRIPVSSRQVTMVRARPCGSGCQRDGSVFDSRTMVSLSVCLSVSWKRDRIGLGTPSATREDELDIVQRMFGTGLLFIS